MGVLLDTSFLYVFYNKNDPKHTTIKKVYSQMLDGEFGQIILLDYVFDELITLISARTRNTKIAAQIGENILHDSKDYLALSFCGERDFRNAWLLFRRQDKKTKFLSFTDCVIISVANSLRNSWVATLDQHFSNWVKVIPERQ